MLPVVYSHDVLGRLHIVCQKRYYEPVQITWWKLELGKKRNGQPYGLVPYLLKENLPLELVPQLFLMV